MDSSADYGSSSYRRQQNRRQSQIRRQGLSRFPSSWQPGLKRSHDRCLADKSIVLRLLWNNKVARGDVGEKKRLASKKGGVFLVTETTQTGNLRFEFIDRIGSADLTVTDTDTGQSVTLRTETISRVPGLESMNTKSILKEFTRKI